MTAKKFYYSVWYQTTYYYFGRRHFKLFTNCHVSWDTLYKARMKNTTFVQELWTFVRLYV